MKKFLKGLSLSASVAMAVGLVGCSDDSPWRGSDTVGGISLTLSTDGRIAQHASRGDDYSSPIVPDGNAFAISLDSHDGSYSKNWTNMEFFNNEEGFPIGDYKIGAAFGDVNREGFELPCFKGESDVHVSPGDTSEVEVIATLANSMVSIRYNDDFIANFPEYSAAVQTPGHDWVVFAQNENRPAYICPATSGYTKVSVTMTNKAGQRVTVEPAKFQTFARRHYIVTINAKGNVASGDMTLEVEFEEDVVNESVNISLTDDLFTSPAPQINAKGFTPDQAFSFIAYEELENDPQFDILGFGGFSEVTMNVSGPSTYTPSFGNPVEFISSEALTRRQLETAGVKVSGLYPVTGLMAIINVKKYLEQVPPGDYTITIQAKDVQTRLSEPVVLKTSVSQLNMEVSLAADVPYRAREVSLIVASNSTKIVNNLSFELKDKDGYPIKSEVREISDYTVPGFALAKKCVLDTDPITTAEVSASVNCGRMTKEIVIDVVDPEYSVEIDAFAKYVILHVIAEDPDLQNDIIDNLVIYDQSDEKVDVERIIRDKENNLITVKGISANMTYEGINTQYQGFKKILPTFKSESATALTNGDFVSQKGTKIYYANVQVGGKYKSGAFDYYNRVTINRIEPEGWATVNALTCAASTNPKNTWFLVPSTYVENQEVVIRTVGYNKNGTVPPRSGDFWNRNYYCENSPEPAQLEIAPGELFLGSYPQNGSRVNGISFSSRPSTLNFDYQYKTGFGEVAQAKIVISDASGAVLSSTSIDLSANLDKQHIVVQLPPYPFGKKANKIEVCFRSTKEGIEPKITIPTGVELQEPEVSLNTDYYYTLPENTYHALATGSVLVIDNVSLGYDKVVGVKDVPNRKSKR